ncbi:MAG: cell division protein FtsW [Firmicutes bacterium]|nr:cell division protein FtsW [Bacillota bacterium]
MAEAAKKKKKIRIKSKFGEGDFYIVVTTLILSVIGIVAVFSASYYTAISKFGDPNYYLKNNAIWMAIGWLAFIVFSMIDYHVWSKFALPAIIVGFFLLLLLFTPSSLGIAKTINQATRWIQIPGTGFTFMPGEIFKPALILFISWYFACKPSRAKTLKGFLPVLIVAGAAFVLIFKQPNLSTAGTVLLMALGMLIVAGIKFGWIALAVGVGAAGFAGLIVLKGSYWLKRVTSFFDPFADPLGDGYQVVQGLLAFGSGGVTGVGLGRSMQKALYLPEAMSDFILPIIGEEVGFIGVMVLLAVYMVLLWRGSLASVNARDMFGTLMAAGITIHLGLQVILNVAVVSASFPPTGVVLPLISLGGTATVLFMMELGILFNISKQASEKETL